MGNMMVGSAPTANLGCVIRSEESPISSGEVLQPLRAHFLKHCTCLKGSSEESGRDRHTGSMNLPFPVLLSGILFPEPLLFLLFRLR